MELRSRSGKGPSPLVVLFVAVFALVACIGGVFALQRSVRAGSNAITPPPLTGSGPSIQVIPAEGGPGTPLQIIGQNWRPADTLFVRLENPVNASSDQVAAFALGTVPPESQFRAQFTFPSDPVFRDTSYVSLTVWSPLSGDRASQPFRLAAAQAPVISQTLGQSVPPVGTAMAATGTVPSAASEKRTPTRAADRATITAAHGDLRSGPGTIYPPVADLPAGSSATVLAQDKAGTWLYVVIGPGLTGWLSRSETDFTGRVQVIAAPSVPPTATSRPTATNTATAVPWYNGWRGEYFASPDLSGSPVLIRDDANINFSWGTSPAGPGVPLDNFSVRWTRRIMLEEGLYRFHAIVDDGVRVYADQSVVIDQWHDGAQRELIGDVWLPAGNHDLKVEYYDRSSGASVSLWWERIPAPVYPNWKGEYWANPNLSGSPVVVRNDLAINFQWSGTSPSPSVPKEHFSARWSRWLDFSPGVYRFSAQADDGIRVYVDGKPVIDQWRDSSGTDTYAVDVPLVGPHWVAIEYFQNSVDAFVRFTWYQVAALPPTPTNTPLPPTATDTAVPPTEIAPPVVFIPSPAPTTPRPSATNTAVPPASGTPLLPTASVTARPATATNTAVPLTNTPLPATSTGVPSTSTPLPITRTPAPVTNTPLPATATPLPPATDTPLPPATNTPAPPPTNTPAPPPTDTSAPQPTDTPAPPPTSTSAPPPTDTPASPPPTPAPTVAPAPTSAPATSPPATVALAQTDGPVATPPPTSPPVPTNAPATSPPATSVPATSPPATSPPATSPPATSAPATSVPATSAPATSPPDTSVPVSGVLLPTAAP